MSGITGLHHVTSIGVDAQRTIDFYTGILGMRLLSRTVNPDEPDVLQFYCAGSDVAPGSLLSFLIHPRAASGRKGNGQVGALTLAVPAHSMEYWERRLAGLDGTDGQAWAFGEPHLCFADPDGLSLCIAADRARPEDGDDPHAIRRIRSVELQLEGFAHTARFLEEVFGFRRVRTEGAVTRFGDDRLENPVALDLVSTPCHRAGSDGPGVTHHVAWRVRDREELGRMRGVLETYGLDVTPELDRHYFRAVYFRLPGGIRFGLAMDGKGFGELAPGRLSLPPWLERRRSLLERRHGTVA